jgi:hypothetical protein
MKWSEFKVIQGFMGSPTVAWVSEWVPGLPGLLACNTQWDPYKHDKYMTERSSETCVSQLAQGQPGLHSEFKLTWGNVISRMT